MGAYPRRQTAYYFCGVMVLTSVGLFAGNWMGVRWKDGGPTAAFLTAAKADPLSELEADERDESVILAQRKRIMGRLRSLEHISRVATTIRPLVDEALRQPSVQADLRALAASTGMSVDEYRDYFAGKQEADLLLESGGDPNARSVADAVGVAQFLASTGREAGLRVDLAASNALSRKLAVIERDLAAIEATAPDWTRKAAFGGGAWGREQWIGYRKGQRDQLVAKRRRADHRFDPAKAIRVQTRYLLKLTRRFGGVDWALQAYHGGVGGVQRTVSLFGRSHGQTRLASRGGSYGRTLPYNELYRSVTPLSAPSAFGYLFGRSDDHRYYWWKALMAERALDLYRKDPAEFERQWRELQPGLSADAAYYPDITPHQFADNGALQQAYRDGTLVRLPAGTSSLGMVTANLASLEPGSSHLFKGLRPEAMGALLRVAHIYRSHGGREPLKVLSMVQTNAYRSVWNARYPEKPLPAGVPKDPEYHTTGLTFDLQRPSDEWSRKVLEFSMGRLYDSLRISWRKEVEGGSRRYHVVVNPEYKAEMAGHFEKLGAVVARKP